MCGQFERVSIASLSSTDAYRSSAQAVAALLERQDTEIEAVHLAIALAYHGLLRVPSRAETSDVTPRMFTPLYVETAFSLSSLT